MAGQSNHRLLPKDSALAAAPKRQDLALEIISQMTRGYKTLMCSTQRSFFSAETKGKGGGGGLAREEESTLCTKGSVKIPKQEFWNYPSAKVKKGHKKFQIIYSCGYLVYFK